MVASRLIYTPQLFNAEQQVARYLVQLLKRGCDKIPAVTDGLSDKQPLAVEGACSNRMFILTGSAGTGKTTTSQRIIQSLRSAGLSGMALCPTGMASRRSKEAAGEFGIGMDFKTVHSGLRWNGFEERFTFNRYNPLKVDFLIVDEFPMLDTWLFSCLLEAINPCHTRLILVGDPNQLPPVGPGNCARDLLACDFIPKVTLTKVFRQGANSGIIHNANLILNGDYISEHYVNEKGDTVKFTDFFNVKSKNPIDSANNIVKYVTESIPQRRNLDPHKDIQVICPGKKSVVGTISLGKMIGDRMNPNGKRCGNFRIGDRVVNNTNNLELAIVNGDVGKALDYSGATGTCLIDFGPGAGPKEDGLVEVKGEALESIFSAWALTVHKLQGSERRAVVMPCHTTHMMNLYRQLLYTGFTRARDLFTLVGEDRAVDMAINNNRPTRRNTNLQSILTSLYNKTSE